MARGVSSDSEAAVFIVSVDDLDRFIDQAEARAMFSVAVTIEAHGYKADILVGHEQSFIHLTPDSREKPYYVTVGGLAEGEVDFWLHTLHHTQFEARHLIPKALARDALRLFFETGQRSPAVEWEEYFA